MVGGIIGVIIGIQAIAQASEPGMVDQAELTRRVNENLGWILIVSSIITLLTLLLISKIKHEKFRKTCGFVKTPIQTLGISTLMGIGISLVVSAVISITAIYKIIPPSESLSNMMTGDSNVFVVFAATVLFAPFLEEVLFRGLIFKELRKGFSMGWAIVLQALLFGLYHFNALQFIYATLGGIVLGILYYKSQSIWTVIVTHVFWNLTSFMITKTTLQNTPSITILLAGMILLVYPVFYLYKQPVQEEGLCIDEALSISSDQ